MVKETERGFSLVIIMVLAATLLLLVSPLVTLELNAYAHGSVRAQTNLNQY